MSTSPYPPEREACIPRCDPIGPAALPPLSRNTTRQADDQPQPIGNDRDPPPPLRQKHPPANHRIGEGLRAHHPHPQGSGKPGDPPPSLPDEKRDQSQRADEEGREDLHPGGETRNIPQPHRIHHPRQDQDRKGKIELISKPWVGSILDLGEPDPGGRRWRFGSGARSNGHSFHPCFLPRPGPGGPGPMIAGSSTGSYRCGSGVVAGRIGLGDRGRIQRRGEDPKNFQRRGWGRRSFGGFGMGAMPRGRWRWRRWGWIPRRSKRKKGGSGGDRGT